MTFLFAKNNGTFGITSTNINDILAAVQPDDILDNLDSIGIRINRYFDSIADNIDYILWITEEKEVSLKVYHDGEEDNVEEFTISPEEVQAIVDYLSWYLIHTFKG